MGLTQTFSDLKRAPLSRSHLKVHLITFFFPARIIKSSLGEPVTFSRKFPLWSRLFPLNALLLDGGICLWEGKGTVFLMMVFGDGIILFSQVTWDLALNGICQTVKIFRNPRLAKRREAFFCAAGRKSYWLWSFGWMDLFGATGLSPPEHKRMCFTRFYIPLPQLLCWLI